MLLRIEAPHFIAGVLTKDWVAIRSAPIISYMVANRWSYDQIRDYCRKKKWKVESL